MNYAEEMHELAEAGEDVKTAKSYTANKYDRARQYIKKEALRGQKSESLASVANALGGSPFHTETLVSLLTADGFVVTDVTGCGGYLVIWPGPEEAEKAPSTPSTPESNGAKGASKS